MISFPKSALVASLMTTTLVAASNTVVTKNFSKGYTANAYASGSGGCEFIYGSSFSVNAYSTLSRFKSTGNGVIKQSTKLDEVFLYYTDSTCDASTVNYRYVDFVENMVMASAPL
jgi:hypothetical protein